jgi:F-type H+-transporting ATPase subunit a
MSMLFSPMETFTIFPVLSLSFTLNNVVLYLLVAAILSPLLLYLGYARGLVIPSGWGVISETLYRTILSTVTSSLGKSSTSYFPLLFSLFYLILFSN